MKRCVVLLDGGIESAASLLEFKASGYEPHALFVRYGQWNQRSQEIATRMICERYNVHRLATTLDVQYFWPPQCIEFPVKLPGHELLLLAHANSLAMMIDADGIVMGRTRSLFNKYCLDRPIYQPPTEFNGSILRMIVRELGLDTSLTYNCYRDNGPCGVCDGCRKRAEWFVLSGMTDPCAPKPQLMS